MEYRTIHREVIAVIMDAMPFLLLYLLYRKFKRFGQKDFQVRGTGTKELEI
jgi:hypothetical protein